MQGSKKLRPPLRPHSGACAQSKPRKSPRKAGRRRRTAGEKRAKIHNPRKTQTDRKERGKERRFREADDPTQNSNRLALRRKRLWGYERFLISVGARVKSGYGGGGLATQKLQTLKRKQKIQKVASCYELLLVHNKIKLMLLSLSSVKNPL